MAPTKILVVEDDPFIQRLYTKLFKEEGFVLTLSPDGTGVVEKVKQEQPDIIMMDIMMPNRNGLEALGDLKANDETKNVPVIMLSASEDDSLLFQAMQAGANRYLVKSRLEPTEVLAIVKEVITQTKNPQ
jgi:CheY-like chemotaxis protein